MRVQERGEGSLAILMEAANDWEIFNLLLRDAVGRGDDWLAKRMGLFVDDEDWDEFAVPEISNSYSVQIDTVAKEVAQARAQAVEGIGEVVVNAITGESWYGVLNQARLGLEGEWKLNAAAEAGEFEPTPSVDELEDEEAPDGLAEKFSAYFRSQLYCFLQVQLLESVLDE